MPTLDPTLDVLWRELHRRYGASGRRVASVHVAGLDPRQREALADLLRLPQLPDPDVRVATGKLAAALHVDEDGLRALVEARHGTAGNRAADRDAALRARPAAAAELAAPAGDDPALAAWAARQPTGTGDELDRRVATARAVIGIVRARRDVPCPLPVVAAETFGNPHALDPDEPAGRMLVGALAERAGRVTVDARSRRRLLRDVAIVADELSSTVVGYRLPIADGHPLAAALAGPEPAPVSLGQLLRHPVTLERTVTVRIVENPAVLAAAGLGGVAVPLLCTSGVPSVAATELVTQLREAGCRLLAHADFDAAGLTIVSQLAALGATPWQMTPQVYRHAAARSAVPLDPSPSEVPWAPRLAATMRQVGTVSFEEHLLDVLLAPGP